MGRVRLSAIGLKLSLLGAALTLAVIEMMSRNLLSQAEAGIVAQACLRAEAYARASREALVPEHDPFALHFATQEMLKEPAIAAAAVLAVDGRILSHTEAVRIGELDGSAAGRRALDSPGPYSVEQGDGFAVGAPIQSAGRRLGAVRLTLTGASLARALAPARRAVYGLAAVAIALNVLGTLLLVSWSLRPLPRLADAARRIEQGEFEHAAVPEGGDELGDLAKVFNRMTAGLIERERIRTVFGRFVPPQVVESLLSGKLHLTGQREEVSVLFSDIRGFTELSEKLAPEEVVSFLNEYFSRMVAIVRLHGGTVDKFIGDGLLAVFGTPLPQKEHALRAAACALEMRSALERFNEELGRRGRNKIRFGVAINTGIAVAGTIGSKDRMEYTVVGDTVNVAARLEGTNIKLNTEMIVSETTYKATRHRFAYKAYGRIALRGHAAPVAVYELLGPLGVETAPHSALVPSSMRV